MAITCKKRKQMLILSNEKKYAQEVIDTLTQKASELEKELPLKKEVYFSTGKLINEYRAKRELEEDNLHEAEGKFKGARVIFSSHLVELDQCNGLDLTKDVSLEEIDLLKETISSFETGLEALKSAINTFEIASKVVNGLDYFTELDNERLHGLAEKDLEHHLSDQSQTGIRRSEAMFDLAKESLKYDEACCTVNACAHENPGVQAFLAKSDRN